MISSVSLWGTGVSPLSFSKAGRELQDLHTSASQRQTGIEGNKARFAGAGDERMVGGTADIRDLHEGVMPSSRAGRVWRSDRQELARRGPTRAAESSAIPADLPVNRPSLRAAAGTVEGKGGVQPGRTLRHVRNRPAPASAALTNTVRQMVTDARP